jgi:hypothetical protein
MTIINISKVLRQRVQLLTCYETNHTLPPLKIFFGNWLLLFYVDFCDNMYVTFVNYLFSPG